MRRTFLIIIAAFIVAGPATAQNISDLNRSRLNTAAYYNYSEPGDVTMMVHVWGALRFTGLYEVPKGTKMTELFSLAGGPVLGARGNRSKIQITVKIIRAVNQNRSIVYEVKMENQIVVTDNDPVIEDGDVLSVESVSRQTIGWRDVFPVIGAAASVVVMIDVLRR